MPLPVPTDPTGSGLSIVWTDEHVAAIEDWASVGLTQSQIAHLLGIHPGTLRQHLAADQALRDAMDRGVAQRQVTMGRKLADLIEDPDTPAAVVLNAVKYWEATRAGKREVKRIEQTGVDGGPIAHSVAGDTPLDELRRRITGMAQRTGSGDAPPGSGPGESTGPAV